MLVESVDFFRLDASRQFGEGQRAELGQFLTPPATARLMASMFGAAGSKLSLLDPGAGVGSLTAAFVAEICSRRSRPGEIQVAAFEIDPKLRVYLESTLRQCSETCVAHGIRFDYEVSGDEFIGASAARIRDQMFAPPRRYDCVIMNPPYRKISTDSAERRALAGVGIETSNLYAAFVALALRLLNERGELVAITPRSFCNGAYFKPFRQDLLGTLSLERIHVFDSRHVAFKDDAVLQENVIFHAVRARRQGPVTISSSSGPDDEFVMSRTVPRDSVVRPDDPQRYIHIVPDEIGSAVAANMATFRASLAQLRIDVSTGRVVDFRATSMLREHPGAKTFPLIYPCNFGRGFVQWPKSVRKPQALADLEGVDDLLVPAGEYVLVKRFSSKEEKRRIVAAVYDPAKIPADRVGFENHLNYFHCGGRGLGMPLAKGLAAFLNSSLVDMYFRQFSGHTQVNATDLRGLRYPRRAELEKLGAMIGERFPDQREIDRLLDAVLPLSKTAGKSNPVNAKRKLDEALEILKALGLPRDQQNERSALTLLSLLDLKPDQAWQAASAPLLGITPMMGFFREHYGKAYAPNTRETVRRQTVHQFLDAGFIAMNPDEPARPTNSGKTVYQVEAGLLALLKVWGTSEWEKALRTYLASVETLKAKYAQERVARRIPIKLPQGKTISLSPGGQNVLVERIMQDFCGFFAPGGFPVYVGDTDEKFAWLDEALMAELGIKLEVHGKMPDVIVYHQAKNWLLLVEAVTSHGPVNAKRMSELKRLFGGSKAGLVFVTAFLDRHSMLKYLDEISWETEVWVADSPTHLIHFNGERFLGPYPIVQ